MMMLIEIETGFRRSMATGHADEIEEKKMKKIFYQVAVKTQNLLSENAQMHKELLEARFALRTMDYNYTSATSDNCQLKREVAKLKAKIDELGNAL